MDGQNSFGSYGCFSIKHDQLVGLALDPPGFSKAVAKLGAIAELSAKDQDWKGGGGGGIAIRSRKKWNKTRGFPEMVVPYWMVYDGISY